MQLSLKQKIIVSGVVVLVAFAFGRYTAPKIPNVATTVDNTKNVNTNTHKTTTITENKDGTKVTKITEDTNKISESENKGSQVVTAPKTSLINISALGSLDTSRGFVPVYGISASKEFIGPITLGAFGLTNGVVGLSVGVNF